LSPATLNVLGPRFNRGVDGKPGPVGDGQGKYRTGDSWDRLTKSSASVNRNFQTKSLCCALGRFTITKEGRLIYHPVRYVMASEAPEGPFGKKFDSVPK
jgi:hypothetical protein